MAVWLTAFWLGADGWGPFGPLKAAARLAGTAGDVERLFPEIASVVAETWTTEIAGVVAGIAARLATSCGGGAPVGSLAEGLVGDEFDGDELLSFAGFDVSELLVSAALASVVDAVADVVSAGVAEFELEFELGLEFADGEGADLGAELEQSRFAIEIVAGWLPRSVVREPVDD